MTIASKVVKGIVAGASAVLGSALAGEVRKHVTWTRNDGKNALMRKSQSLKPRNNLGGSTKETSFELGSEKPWLKYRNQCQINPSVTTLEVQEPPTQAASSDPKMEWIGHQFGIIKEMKYLEEVLRVIQQLPAPAISSNPIMKLITPCVLRK